MRRVTIRVSKDPGQGSERVRGCRLHVGSNTAHGTT